MIADKIWSAQNGLKITANRISQFVWITDNSQQTAACLDRISK